MVRINNHGWENCPCPKDSEQAVFFRSCAKPPKSLKDQTEGGKTRTTGIVRGEGPTWLSGKGRRATPAEVNTPFEGRRDGPYKLHSHSGT